MNKNELEQKIKENIEKIKKGIKKIKNKYIIEQLKDYRLLGELEKNLNDPNKLVEIYRESNFETRDENEIRWNSIFDQIAKMNNHPENFWMPFHDLEEIFNKME